MVKPKKRELSGGAGLSSLGSIALSIGFYGGGKPKFLKNFRAARIAGRVRKEDE